MAAVRIGNREIASFRGEALPKAEFTARKAEWLKTVGAGLADAGYPTKADPAEVNTVLVVALLWVLAMYVTMVYAPLAAALVEMFPARIRYTSMSLPYHIGNGWFGGFLPTTAFAIVAATGNIYAGLWYPIGVAAVTVVVGGLWFRETKNADVHD